MPGLLRKKTSQLSSPVIGIDKKDVILNVLKRYISRALMQRITETMSVHSIRIWDRYFRTIQVIGHNLEGDIRIKVTFQPGIALNKTYWTNMHELEETVTPWTAAD